jgi:hypothetical protein
MYADGSFKFALPAMRSVTLHCLLPYFPAHKTHCDFFVRNFTKNNDECILISVNYWKKTGLLHTKISNHNIMMPELVIWKQISQSQDKDDV